MAKRPTGGLTAPRGFLAAGTTCGIKASGRPDMALIVSDRPCVAAGLFTQNRLPGAPVVVAKRHLRDGMAQAVTINSGIANDATGQSGIENAVETCRVTAEELRHVGVEVNRRNVLPSSTGVIGPQLPMDRIGRGVATLVSKLGRGPRHDRAAAAAIMTTDLVPKLGARRLRLGGRQVHIGGIAKGSGMIAPNMATMLVFLTTDAAIRRDRLQAALRAGVATSFNRISIDGHTSPSDMVVILANGAAGHSTLARASADLSRFEAALADLCCELAYELVKDGEGASKVFRVQVNRARSEREADCVAREVVNSPLVKCAVHGGDPNWGRIVTAAANSGVAFRPDHMSLRIGDDPGVVVFKRGAPIELKRVEVRRLSAIMRKKDVTFQLDLDRGQAKVEWIGCDLSRKYVTINADYTT